MRFLLPAFLTLAQILDAALGPAESAAEFAKKLASQQVNLSPTTDTAIMSEIGDSKKASILQRLQRLAQDIKGDEIQIGPVRTEGSLAGVILRLVDPANPSNIQVIPLAMVQDEGVWRAAPVPASFENTSANYSRTTRELARSLEAWLANEQVGEMERIQQAAESLLRESMAKSLAPDTLRNWTDEEAINAFLDACDQRDTNRILALMGGLSSPTPEGWSQAAAAARTAISTPAPKADPWTLLTSPTVVRGLPVRVNSAPSQPQEYSVLCMDPRNGDTPTIYRQNLIITQTSDGLREIRPTAEPDSLSADSISTTSLFPDKFPLQPKASASELKQALLESFRSKKSPYSCLHLLHRDNIPDSDLPRFQDAVQTCWQTLNPALIIMPLELGFLEEANHAYLALNWLSLTRLSHSSKIIHLQKSPAGWVWNNMPDNGQVVAAETWVKINEATWKSNALASALQACAKLDPTLPPPAESAASSVVGDWLNALANNNWHTALSLCTQLGTAKSPTELLRNLGYECKNIRLHSSKPSFEQISSGKSLLLFATRSPDKDKPILTLLPVVNTPDGPRILLEIDLGDPARPGRSFLNRNSLERLKSAQPTMAEELKTMLAALPGAK